MIADLNTYDGTPSALARKANAINELRLERAVHRLVVGDLIVDMGLVEGGAIELRQFCTFALTGPRCDLAI